MKKLLFRPAYLTLTFLLATAPLPAQTRSPWFVDFRSAEATAKRQGDNLLIHFYAGWCGPCQTMERTVLRSQRLEKMLESGIVAVRVNLDLQPGVARRFRITSIPADVVVSPTGELLAKYHGQRSFSSFVATIERFRNRTSGRASVSADENHRSVATGSHAVGRKYVTQTSSSTATPGRNVVTGVIADADAATPGAGLTSVFRTAQTQTIGLGGYCPVLLSQKTQWTFGRGDLRHEYDGVQYQFATKEARSAFMRDPEKYVPAFHGYDVVAHSLGMQLEPGAIELGARFRDRLYFFKSTENRDMFLERPHHFAAEADVSVVQTQPAMK